MTTYNTWDELIQESERNMLQLDEDKEYCFSIYKEMRECVDLCLKSNEYQPLFDLLPYFEKPEDYPRLRHTGETRRLNIMINALKLETKYHKNSFLSTTTDYENLFEQYTLTIFALRRLELKLSETSIEEAENYLTSIPFNIYIARLIIENEYFENYENLYQSLYHCFKNIWSIPDKIQWLVCLFQKAPNNKTLLEISSLYIELSDYKSAYHYLTKIASPSPEAKALISSIKELFHYE